MGGSCCGFDERNQQINVGIGISKEEDSRMYKLLLLGPGSTGKSTLFRSLQMSHNNGQLSKTEKEYLIPIIRANILDSIQILIKQSANLYGKDSVLYNDCEIDIKSNENTEKEIEFLLKTEATIFYDDSQYDDELLIELCNYILNVWNLPFIQATFKYRNKNLYAISDNLEYFFNNDKLLSIFSKNYLPNDNDCLLTRNKSTGVTEYCYIGSSKLNVSKQFVIYDFGGQRNERKKWIHYFDAVHGLIFVGSLVSYSRCLYEDGTCNSQLECLKLFGDIMSLDTFDNCAIILILNKDDILIELLKQENNGLSDCFSEKGHWPNENEYWNSSVDKQYWDNHNNNNNTNDNNDDNDENKYDVYFDEFHNFVKEFLKQLYFRRLNNDDNGNNEIMKIQNENETKEKNKNNKNNKNKNKQKDKHKSKKIKQVHCHTTVATQNSIVNHVFQNIEQTVIINNLAKAGFASKNKLSNNNDNNNGKESKNVSQNNNDNNGLNLPSGKPNMPTMVASATSSLVKENDDVSLAEPNDE